MTNNLDSLIYIASVFVVVSTQIDNLTRDKCKTQRIQPSQCISFNDCPFAKKLLQMRNVDYIYNLTCGFDGKIPLVCCPIVNNEDALNFPSANISPFTTVAAQTQIIRSTTYKPAVTEDVTNQDIKPTDVITPENSNNTSASTVRTYLKENDTKLLNESIPQFENKSKENLPSSTISPLLPNRHVCGTTTTITNRIVGGEITDPNEFPWVVRLKFYNLRANKTSYSCGGTLISDRYVITAAHCVTNKYFQLIEVRLGEWNEDTDEDCYHNICIDQPVDISVEEIITHPEYKNTSFHSDIALVRLSKSVTFTEFLRPICLPNTDYISKADNSHGFRYWASGWGRTEKTSSSAIKRKILLSRIDYEVCHLAYMANTPAKSAMICAGGRKNEDTCQGDSGGPLMQEVSENDQINWFIYGIISGGSNRCGTEGFPGFYTRVATYMDWILGSIKP